MQDQFAYIRIVCNKQGGTVSNDALMELCVLLYLTYRNRLVNGNAQLCEYHVKYNNTFRSDQAVEGSTAHTIRNHGNYAEIGNIVVAWLNGHKGMVRHLTNNFANIV